MDRPIQEVVNLVEPDSQRLSSLTVEQAERLMTSRDPTALSAAQGSFALLARDGDRVFLARSLDRPLRYFLAKQASGPLLVVAERIDAIRRWLERAGYGDQFHPSYTRMAPAHYVTCLRLLGCPDPNPVYRRFLETPPEELPADLDAIGSAYVETLIDAMRTWLSKQDEREPIGVLFSGGVDSGAVLLGLHDLLIEAGQSLSRLKAFTLAIDGAGSDLSQARDFLRRMEMDYLGESVEVARSTLDPFAAVELIEDYKVRDVECATVNAALLAQLRRRYPHWRLLVDGDGGDENFKDYPIEENPELTIRSVVNNALLYQEGWGVDSIKHSLTYSGGFSRGCVRTFAPLRRHGFTGFSPNAQPSVVAVAAAIPFAELAQGSPSTLYGLKGELLQRGVKAVLGRSLPVFPKRRFQEGSTARETFTGVFSHDEHAYRRHFMSTQAQL